MKKKQAQLFKRSTKQKKPSDLNSSEASMILNSNSNSTSIIRPKTKSPIPTPIPQSPLTTISISLPNSKMLTQSFFQIDALDLAPRLLGKFLRRDDVVLQITEVEAYRPNDTACHGRFGITARTAPIFGPGGHAYVYLCYGLHTMLNIVADKQGVGAAVLVRACAPISGLETIQQRRGQMTEKPVLLAGPGKVGQALGISTEWSNHPLYTPGGLEMLDGPEPEKILVGAHVGIEYASPEDVNALWRFAIVCKTADHNDMHLKSKRTLQQTLGTKRRRVMECTFYVELDVLCRGSISCLQDCNFKVCIGTKVRFL